MSQGRRRAGKSLSQPSTSRANNSSEIEDDLTTLTQAQDRSMSDEEHAQNVAKVIKYILAADRTKVPILRTNIVKSVNFEGSNFKSVLKSARTLLRDVFGYDLVEVDQDKKSSAKFILCNNLLNPHLIYEVSNRDKYALLFLVLSHIFMSGEECNQASLESFLRHLGIIAEDNANSDIYGDVMELILVEFVKERYIAAKKSEITENELELSWGERAMREVPVRSIMKFVGQVYETDPKKWTVQYEKMLKLEQDQMRASKGTENQNRMEE